QCSRKRAPCDTCGSRHGLSLDVGERGVSRELAHDGRTGTAGHVIAGGYKEGHNDGGRSQDGGAGAAKHARHRASPFFCSSVARVCREECGARTSVTRSGRATDPTPIHARGRVSSCDGPRPKTTSTTAGSRLHADTL